MHAKRLNQIPIMLRIPLHVGFGLQSLGMRRQCSGQMRTRQTRFSFIFQRFPMPLVTFIFSQALGLSSNQTIKLLGEPW